MLFRVWTNLKVAWVHGCFIGIFQRVTLYDFLIASLGNKALPNKDLLLLENVSILGSELFSVRINVKSNSFL